MQMSYIEVWLHYYNMLFCILSFLSSNTCHISCEIGLPSNIVAIIIQRFHFGKMRDIDVKIPNLYMKAVALGGCLPSSMAGETPGNQSVTSVRKGLFTENIDFLAY